MDEQKLAKRLKQLREQSGILQEDAEQLLDLPGSALTRIELGQRKVSALELGKFAKLYSCSIADLFSDAEEDLLLVLHRLEPGLKKNNQIKAAVHRYTQICRECSELEKFLNRNNSEPTTSYNLPAPKNTMQAIMDGDRVAKAERRRLGLDSGPLYNIASLLSQQEIRCVSAPLLEGMSGFYLRQASIGTVIVVNNTHNYSRKRFSFAHEYAHALFDSAASVLISNQENASTLIETRANAFAASFLMPAEGIAELIKKLGKGHMSRETQSVFDVATEKNIEAEERFTIHKIAPHDVAHIAHHFRTSYQAMTYRLNSLKYISKKEQEELLAAAKTGADYLKEMNYSDENTDSDQNSELIHHATHLAIEAYRQGEISRGRFIELMQLLDLPPDKMLQVAGA